MTPNIQFPFITIFERTVRSVKYIYIVVQPTSRTFHLRGMLFLREHEILLQMHLIFKVKGKESKWNGFIRLNQDH